MTNFNDVKKFMETFGQEVKNKAEFPKEKIVKLRLNLIQEELEEFREAIKKKDIKSYQLHNFNISAEIANEILLFDNNIKNLKRKFLINLDKFKSKKKFLIEDKGLNKITEFYHYNTDCFLNNVYVLQVRATTNPIQGVEPRSINK